MPKKTLAKLKKDAQKVFNAYIRARDKGKPCISCGIKKEEHDAGHFYAVQGYDALRFNEDNCHGQCVGCNRFDPSHLIGYADNIVSRIGLDRLGVLKKAAKDYKMNGYKWQRYEVLEIIEKYKQKLKEFD